MVEIKCEEVRFSGEKQAELKAWLNRGELNLLRQVAEARAKTAFVACIRAARVSQKHPGKLEAANADLEKAHRYQVFLDVLEEIVTEPSLYATVKLT